MMEFQERGVASTEKHTSSLEHEASMMQKGCGVCSIICSIVGLILLVQWVNADLSDKGFDGYNWQSKIFGYHPTLMYSAFILGCFTAVISFRLLPLPKPFSKFVHGLCHTGALVCMILGLYAVFHRNNDSDINNGNYFANLYTTHSYIGLGTVIIFFLNYMFGLIHFIPSLDVIPLEYRQAYMPFHVFFGTFVIIGSSMAVESGLMETYTLKGCKYTVTSADLNPAENYHDLPYGCRMANGTGVLTYLSLILMLFALFNFGPNKQHDHKAPLL